MNGYLYAFDLSAKPATAPGTDFKSSTYCYPNPARDRVSHIQIYVDKPATALMTIYNNAEKPVFQLTRQLKAGEKYTYNWNLSQVANGVYFALVKVQYADGSSDKKVLKVAVLK
jgi:hypothetical protein